jgi:hypothetical protein
MSPRERRAHRVAVGLAAFLVIAIRAGSVTGTAGDAEIKQIVGTVKAVEPDARRISVITGTGHAVRLLAFHADTTCRIEVGGVVSAFNNLHPGQIVEVSYRLGTEPYAAERIATPPPQGVVRRP